jgi:hypothetical protein
MEALNKWIVSRSFLFLFFTTQLKTTVDERILHLSDTGRLICGGLGVEAVASQLLGWKATGWRAVGASVVDIGVVQGTK